jgi:AcrR family transcriptional regulator
VTETATRRRLSPEARKQHIIESAAAAIAASGVIDLTMEQIAEHAGVSRGLLYNYFDNVEEIVLAVHRAEAAVLEDATRAAMAEADGDLTSVVATAARVWLERFAERGPLLAILFAPQASDSPLADVERRRAAATHVLWTEAYAAAAAIDERTASDLTAMLLYAFSGALARLESGRSPAELADLYVDLTLGALERVAQVRRDQ